MIENSMIDHESVFRVGKVVSVEGRRVRISVDKLKNSPHLIFRGGLVRNVAVGSYVKIVKGFAELVAKIDGEVIEEDRNVSSDYHRGVDRLSRQLELSLIGFIENGRFERGVREMPLLDNECFILTEPEFRLIHSFVSADDESLTLGTLAMESTHPVEVGINAIFASHVGIFGNTGSGKSYTLAKLYYELFRRYGTSKTFREHAQFVVIDFNGEYANRPGPPNSYAANVIASDELKDVYELSTYDDNGDKLPLPKSAVHDPIFWRVLLDATEKTQAPFIERVLKSDYWDNLLPNSNDLLEAIADLVARATTSSDPAIDRQLPANFLEEIEDCLSDDVQPSALSNLIDEMRRRLSYHSKHQTFYWVSSNGSRIWATEEGWAHFIKQKILGTQQDFSSVGDVDLVRFKLVLQYYRDVISGFANREHLGPLMKRMTERVPSIKRLISVYEGDLTKLPLTVISLRNVNLAMRKVIPMLVCKHLYDNKKRKDPKGEKYLNLVIDEAHNILSAQSARESEAWRDYRLETFEEIVKEGRKFGVFLTIASQRPHDISETIVSQLHNYFLHRLVNNLDIHAIEKAVAYLDRVSFESLPILPTGTCVLAGISAQVPVLMKIGQLPDDAAPNSRTMDVASKWVLTSIPQPAETIIETEPSDPFNSCIDEPPF